MPVPESRWVACLDCKRGPKSRVHAPDSACSCGWQARTRHLGCYLGERIPGTRAKKGEQGHGGVAPEAPAPNRRDLVAELFPRRNMGVATEDS